MRVRGLPALETAAQHPGRLEPPGAVKRRQGEDGGGEQHRKPQTIASCRHRRGHGERAQERPDLVEELVQPEGAAQSDLTSSEGQQGIAGRIAKPFPEPLHPYQGGGGGQVRGERERGHGQHVQGIADAHEPPVSVASSTRRPEARRRRSRGTRRPL